MSAIFNVSLEVWEGKRMGRKFTQWISSLLPLSLAEDPGWCLPGMLQLLASLAVPVSFQATAFQFTGCKHSPGFDSCSRNLKC